MTAIQNGKNCNKKLNKPLTFNQDNVTIIMKAKELRKGRLLK